MSPEKCSDPYCRDHDIHITVRGMPLCEKHWDERCAKDHEAHKIQHGSGQAENTGVDCIPSLDSYCANSPDPSLPVKEARP